MCGYVENSRRLLEEARSGENPFEGCTPQQPNRVDVTALDGFYDRMEALGARQFAKMGVVMVAGDWVSGWALMALRWIFRWSRLVGHCI